MKTTLSLQIGKLKFKVSVDESEKAATLAAARKVESMLKEQRTRSNTVDKERAALMVALQLALGHGDAGSAQQAELAGVELAIDEALGLVDAAAARS